MATKKILDAYKNANREAVVESDDPQALIMLLLDELLRAMRGYVNDVKNKDSKETLKSDQFTRSLTVLYGLQSCLNFDEGGEIAENLFRLYEYARVQLLHTSQTGEIDGTQVAISSISEIREAWSVMEPKAEIQNVGYVFLRDGSVHAQEKIHPTPSERHWWNIKGGDEIITIPTDCGPIGVLICYDSEFPELARKLVDAGAKLLFVPFCTDNRQGYMRVRYCSQARAIENQCYVVMAGNVGNLPGVENMDIQYAKSCILTPCDFPFARDGIAEECTENVETVSIADLDLTDLDWARLEGTVRNLRDRRFDLYAVKWAK